jgi:hypothetical protein
LQDEAGVTFLRDVFYLTRAARAMRYYLNFFKFWNSKSHKALKIIKIEVGWQNRWAPM